MKKSFLKITFLGVILSTLLISANLFAQNPTPFLSVTVYQTGHCQISGYGQSNASVWVYDSNNKTVIGPGTTDQNGVVNFSIPAGFSYGTYTIESVYPPPPNNSEIGTTTWNYSGGSDYKTVCLTPNMKHQNRK